MTEARAVFSRAATSPLWSLLSSLSLETASGRGEQGDTPRKGVAGMGHQEGSKRQVVQGREFCPPRPS